MQVIVIGSDKGKDYLDLVEFCATRGIKLVEEKITPTKKQSTPCRWRCACGKHVTGDYCECGAYKWD